MRSRAFYRIAICRMLAVMLGCGICVYGQSTNTSDETSKKLKELSEALQHTQEQIEESQRQLQLLRSQIHQLQQQMANVPAQTPQESNANAANEELRERVEMHGAQIAVHEQTKVETASKYSLRLTGQVLFNGFVNSSATDYAAMPSYVVPGSGTAGLSMRQTVLGFDATGPHLLGAQSYASLRMDFFGRTTQQPINTAEPVLRLLTARAALKWKNTEVFFSHDRPILAPWAPESLTAVSTPALAWSGTLWSWHPQIGITHSFHGSGKKRVILQGALVDVLDPPPAGSSFFTTTATERSGWPAVMGRIAFAGGGQNDGPQLGFGGYYSPHKSLSGQSYNAWAGTADFRLPISHGFQLTGNIYGGRALGGLGEGGWKDYIDGSGLNHGLGDIGGWIQFKQAAGDRWSFHEAYGIDNVLANDVRPYLSLLTGPSYIFLARQRTTTANVIYAPRAYLLFSAEYRFLQTNNVTGKALTGHIGGLAAAYRF